MTKSFKAVHVGFVGFVTALVGAALGFGGFHLGERWLWVAGFTITTIGVVVGFIGIVYGWMTHGKQAVAGSVRATTELRDKMKQKRE